MKAQESRLRGACGLVDGLASEKKVPEAVYETVGRVQEKNSSAD